MSVKIALAGNPNCGKTTLFNALTGSNQFVGNWPGVTVEKKEGKERGQTNRETGGKTACDSWDPAHPAWDPKVETRADGADYAGCGTGRLFFLSGRKRKKLPDRRRKQFGRCSRKIPVGTIFKIPGREEAGLCVGDAWGCGSLKCSGRTSGTEKVWSRNPVSDFSGTEILG